MFEIESLVFALIALCLAEGFRVVHPSAWILRKGIRRRWRTSRPFHYPGNGEWGWYWASPFPFFRNRIVLEPALVRALSSGVVFMPGRGRHTAEYLPSAVARRLSWNDRNLGVDECHSARPAFAETAMHTLREMKRVQDASDAARAAIAAEILDQRFDTNAIHARLRAVRRSARLLQFLSGMQTILIILVLPVAVLFLRFDGILISLLAAILSIAVATGCAAWWMRGRAAFSRDAIRPSAIVQYFVFPPKCCFAFTDLLAASFVNFEAAAVTGALAPGDDAIAAVRETWIENRYPAWDSPDAAAPASEWADWLVHLERLLRGALPKALSEEWRIGAAPVASPDAHYYCPRCGTSYRANRAFCGDCPGVELELLPLPEKPEAPPGKRRVQGAT